MLESLVGAVLGGVVEALAGKSLDGESAWRAERVRRKIGGQDNSLPAKAVRRVIGKAREEILKDYADDPTKSSEVIALLDHRPFATEVTRRLLERGEPDFERLRRHYLEQDGNTSERWTDLEEPLEALFDAMERHLAGDDDLGEVIRDARRLKRLGSLDESNRIIAVASQGTQLLIEQGLEEQSRHARTIEDNWSRLLQLIEDRGADSPSGGKRFELTAEEDARLRVLASECDRLPLAMPMDPDRKSAEGTASLANVYVSLDVERQPSKLRILERLRVPEEQREEILAELSRDSESSGRPRPAERQATAELEMEGAAHGLPAKLGNDHPLYRWAPDKDSWTAAIRPLSALEALADHRKLVLLGKPGSGKSSFVNHLATLSARARLGMEDIWAEELSELFPQPFFPLPVILRRWSAQLDGDESKSRSRKGRPRQPRGQEALELAYRAIEEATGLPRNRILDRLTEPMTLVLFDGLDEVPEPEKRSADGDSFLDRRQWIRAAISAFCTAHEECRVLVTCRVKPYQDPAYQLPAFPSFTLAPLDEERIERFVHRWYAELSRVGQLDPEKAKKCRDRLLDELRHPDRDVLREMAETPLLLTMLARVNASAPLPGGREQLYGECVKQLLWEWERSKDEDGKHVSLERLLAETSGEISQRDFEHVLWEQTFKAHGSSGKKIVDLPASRLEAALAAKHPDPHDGKAWASRLIGLMQTRGGLLVDDGQGNLTFPHRSFQEYLAARWLVERRSTDQIEIPRLAEQQVWREVILLASSYLARNVGYRDVEDLVNRLVSGRKPTQAKHWQRILVAGRAWLEFGPQRASQDVGEDLKAKIPPLLTQLMQHPDLPAKQRLEAGLTLADLGDELDVAPGDLDYWVELSTDALDYAFKIAKYPVTNAQYERFLKAGGLASEPDWWGDELRKEYREWRNEQGEEWRRAWSVGERGRNAGTQPVTGVSWYEALAYCAWLTEELRAKGTIGAGEEIRLPTLAEWERAAAGREEREYPWEGGFERWRANTEESGLGQPTPVHMYPGGKTPSPEEVFDLAGNVWEWSSTETDYGGRQLTGGACWNDKENVTTSSRLWIPPSAGLAFIGFRCVCVPVPRADPES